MHRTPNSVFFLSIASVAPVIRALGISTKEDTEMLESNNFRKIVIDVAQEAIIGTLIDYDVDKGSYEGQVISCTIDDVYKINVSNEMDYFVYTVTGRANCAGQYLDYDGITHTKDHNFEIEVTVSITPISYDSGNKTIKSTISTNVITAYVVD